MGLPYEELLQSEWVQNDTIVFKVCIQEHPMPSNWPERLVDNEIVSATPLYGIEVPPSTVTADFLAMLTDGRHSDVTVEVVVCDNAAATTTFAAHACILSQRSDVFRAALSHDMRESETKTIRVTDLAPLAVKALLFYLYSGSLEEVEKAVQRVTKLEHILAAAHKYQVSRLLAWCEQQLCKTLELPSVCALLSLALLYEAMQLTHTCLTFMKTHHAEVVKLDAFVTLPHEALIRFHQHCAGVDPAEAGGGCKRKRGAE